jgi:hypothetical protein
MANLIQNCDKKEGMVKEIFFKLYSEDVRKRNEKRTDLKVSRLWQKRNE